MIEFANKTWLYLLPVAVILLLLLFQVDRRGRRVSIRRFASDRLVQGLLKSYSPFRKRLKNIVLVLAACFLFLALARPQWGHTWTETSSRGIDIVFALDTSRSMLAQDIKPNRLIRAKLAIEDFVNQLEGDRIGLVAFSGSAFLQSPLTLDYDAFFQSLDAIDTNAISAGGTDLSAAIKESEAAFSADNNFKIVVLITDGEDLEGSGIDQARKSAENGVTIYSVGVGTPDGAPIPIRTRTGQIEYVRDENGQVVQTRLEPETLQTIAESTGGFYVPLGTTGYGLEQVLEAGVGSIPEEEISSQLQRTAIERFQWPLGIALLLFALEPLIGTRRRWRFGRKSSTAVSGVAVLMTVGLCLPSERASAQEIQDPAAAEIAEAEETRETVAPKTMFARAVEEDPLNPIAYFNRGTELYEEEKYPEASKFFTQALRFSDDFLFQADAFYNLGNTHYNQGLFSFGETPPGAVTEAATTVSGQNQPPMQAGRQILETAERQPPPQQQIQQAISALEERKTATEESVKNLGTAMENEQAVQKLWQRSVNDFESALELAPGHEDARHNLEFVKQQAAGLAAQIATQKRLREDQERQSKEIERLIEELKKLLEEQQDQQDQNQNQNQQDQQQQNENENQEQQQNQDSSDQNQEQQEQQEQQESSEQQDGQQNQQDQQSGEQDQQQQDGQQNQSNEGDSQSEEEQPTDASEQQSENESTAEEESDSESSEGQEPEPEDAAESGEEDAPESGEESDTGVDEQESDAQSTENGQGLENEPAPGEEEQESMELSEEQAEEIAEDLAAAAAASGEEAPAGTGEEVVIGVMSSEDAARLLDSLKRSERKLPYAGRGSEGAPDSDDRRNW